MTDTPEPAGESDDSVEVPAVELKSSEPPQRRICLTYGDQSVEIIGPDDMTMLSSLAASLWVLTTPPREVRMGFTAGNTLYMERSPSDLGEQDEREQPA